MKKLIIFIEPDLTTTYALYDDEEIYYERLRQCDIKNKQYDEIITINTKRKIPNAKYKFNLFYNSEKKIRRNK